MAATDSTQVFLQYPIFTRFLLPFFLIFFIIFAILERTKIFGKDNSKQINALISFIIGLIFVTFLSPTLVLSNLVLFLSIGLVIVLIVLMLWGFLTGDHEMKIFEKSWLKVTIFIIVIIAVIFGVVWSFGISPTSAGGSLINSLFNQPWSSTFWTNVVFVVLIAATLALVIGKAKKSS